MIYWFTGQPGVGKTVLANKLKELLATEKRNWRKDVFHIDGDIFSVEEAQIISSFLNSNNCDVVVSITSPNLESREKFKNQIGGSIVEFHVHKKSKKDSNTMKNYEQPLENFFDVDTIKDNPNQSFNKIIHYLNEIDKL